jgi:hypothetical protein
VDAELLHPACPQCEEKDKHIKSLEQQLAGLQDELTLTQKIGQYAGELGEMFLVQISEFRRGHANLRQGLRELEALKNKPPG